MKKYVVVFNSNEFSQVLSALALANKQLGRTLTLHDRIWDEVLDRQEINQEVLPL